MEKYENAEMELIFFDNADVICTSGGEDENELPMQRDDENVEGYYETHGQRS